VLVYEGDWFYVVGLIDFEIGELVMFIGVSSLLLWIDVFEDELLWLVEWRSDVVGIIVVMCELVGFGCFVVVFFDCVFDVGIVE